MSRIVHGENHMLIEPFEFFFLYTSPREEHGNFKDCLYERENIAISILHSHYAELAIFDDNWFSRLKLEYQRFIQEQTSVFEDISIDNVIKSMISCSRWKDQIDLLTSLTWKPGTLGHVISSLERYGFKYSSYSNVRNFNQDGLGATLITSNEDETIIYSNCELDFSEKANMSRVKQSIEQAIPRTIVVMDNPEGKWCMFEFDRRSLFGLERGSSHHIHFSSNLKNRGSMSNLIDDFKSGEKMSHSLCTHVIYSEFEDPVLNLPLKCSTC